MKRTMLMVIATFAAGMQAQQNNFQSSGWMGAAHQYSPRKAGQAGPVTGKPFSGIETRITRQVLGDGSVTNTTSITKIYRDAEGRMRSESGNNMMLFDPPNHVTYTIYPQHCTSQSVREENSVIIYATEHGTNSDSFGGTSKPPAGMVSEDLGWQVVDGISAHGTRQTLTIPASALGSDHDLKVVHEQWYSDALGILVKSINTDPRFGTTTYELSNINQSTPDASLFAVPSSCPRP